jgi:von Willebrand factor type A domain
MKNNIIQSLKELTTGWLILFILFNSSCTGSGVTNSRSVAFNSRAIAEPVPPDPDAERWIKIALLLDTSNSMDGLIDQAKSQLWKFVNALSGTSADGVRPNLHIALYEYGNDGLSSHEGFVRQVLPFTQDLDLVSEKLFSLKTNGGNEYCGKVITSSLEELIWSGDNKDLQMIFIAGNEAFTQGPVSFQSAGANAKEKSVVINTIFCGSFDEGVSTKWKDGATLTGGTYMSIEQDRKTVYVDTPFDITIDSLNNELNATYIYYGADGNSKLINQSKQDFNAESYGRANKIERSVSKANGFYSNESWDLVDAYNDKKIDLSNLKESEWPEILREKPMHERMAYIESMNSRRIQVKIQINECNIKRQNFILKNSGTASTDESLDGLMMRAIREQAVKKGFQFI